MSVKLDAESPLKQFSSFSPSKLVTQNSPIKRLFSAFEAASQHTSPASKRFKKDDPEFQVKFETGRNVRVARVPTLPKFTEEVVVTEDDYTIKKSLHFKDKNYQITPFIQGARDHQVWMAESDGQKFILKTYHHLVDKSRQKSVIDADTKGYLKIEQFLNEQHIDSVRLATFYSNPSIDGILLMEYVEGQNAFGELWPVGQQPSDEALQVLTCAKNLIKQMWEHKVDLGDFRPDNVIWKQNQLVIIDYTLETDSKDLVGHLQHYLEEWAKGNVAVREFLYKGLEDLCDATPYEDESIEESDNNPLGI